MTENEMGYEVGSFYPDRFTRDYKRCPYCRSMDVEDVCNDLISEASMITSCRCNECDGEWDILFSYQGFVPTELPEED